MVSNVCQLPRAVRTTISESRIPTFGSGDDGGPILFPKSLAFILDATVCGLLSELRPLTPIVRLCDNRESWSEWATADSIKFNSDSEKGKFLRRRSIQKVDRGAVLFTEIFGNPDYGTRLDSGSIGKQLSQVTMIRRRQLVLDEDPTFRIRFLGQDIRRERATAFSTVSQTSGTPISSEAGTESASASHRVKFVASFGHAVRKLTFSSRARGAIEVI